MKFQNLRPIGWDVESSPERESSPPMPSIPPPPPPALDDDPPGEPLEEHLDWPDFEHTEELDEDDEPHAIALFDYFTDHPDDLCFSVSVFLISYKKNTSYSKRDFVSIIRGNFKNNGCFAQRDKVGYQILS